MVAVYKVTVEAVGEYGVGLVLELTSKKVAISVRDQLNKSGFLAIAELTKKLD